MVLEILISQTSHYCLCLVLGCSFRAMLANFGWFGSGLQDGFQDDLKLNEHLRSALRLKRKRMRDCGYQNWIQLLFTHDFLQMLGLCGTLDGVDCYTEVLGSLPHTPILECQCPASWKLLVSLSSEQGPCLQMDSAGGVQLPDLLQAGHNTTSAPSGKIYSHALAGSSHYSIK